MTKAELITAMAEGAVVTKAAAGKALEAYTAAVAKELKKSGRLGLVGFGTFSVVKRKAREGRNPQTGKTIKIAAKKVIKFKAGKALADTVNKGK
ncbi:MAG: DNA-binding protein [Syntrophobacterales bacterium RBG_19FT_COMBO_59_10]|nr:MAG: DNA-binding protein [Syntrophobacterales bacterium RBG_19FT_COMBO_59_10]